MESNGLITMCSLDGGAGRSQLTYELGMQSNCPDQNAVESVADVGAGFARLAARAVF